MEESEQAVVFRDAFKTFGSRSTKVTVLSHFYMNVPKGVIYGLLGASGCGKTTILSCISGLLKLDSGDLKVLGVIPGTKGCGIPGSRVGYMPQEVALIENMTIKNTLYYFGWLFGMRNPEIAERHEFLSKLLDLPTDDRLTKDMSGGQQRRVSLAAALVQTPELLLLDEPTVGLDPVLRQSIWDYLGELTRDRDMTIVITTHYIEEARQANKIGFLREGILLAEAAPDDVIIQCNCNTLEEAYLLLSHQQITDQSGSEVHSHIEESEQDTIHETLHSTTTDDVLTETDRKGEVIVSSFRSVAFDEKIKSKKPIVARPVASFLNRMMALVYKDTLSILRNYPGLFFLFFLPSSLISLLFVTVGKEGHNLPLGVVNDEIANCGDMIGYIRNTSGVEIYERDEYFSCHYQGLSCLFIDMLQESSTVRLIFYEDQETALAASKRNANQALIYFPSNFSDTLETRHNYPTKDDEETIANSEISAWIDMSDYIIGYQLKKYLFDTYVEFIGAISDRCHINKNAFKFPVKFLDPVYGRAKQGFLESIAPGIILVIIHTFSATMTATLLVGEKSTGLWHRNLVAGATMQEIVLSQLVCNLVASLVQTAEAMFLSFYVFGLECRGSLVSVFWLIFVQSVGGVSFGIFSSSLANTLMDANVFIIAVVVPYSMLTGVLWPIPALPDAMLYIGYITPVTFSTIGFSNIVVKGFGLWNSKVWPGLAVPLVWIAIFNIIAMYLLKRK